MNARTLFLIAISSAMIFPVANAVSPALPTEPQLMNVGFFTLPENVEQTGEYNGERVLSVNHDINFVALEVQNPTVFRARVVLDDNVKYITNDYKDAVHAFFTPNDPGYAQQYGWPSTNTPAAWDVTQGTTAVTVAVLDTGIQASHPDFTPARVLTGITYAGGNQRADGNGHGTHVSGTVGATINNGIGGAGASQSNILPVKVLDDAGSGTFAGVADGITWAANNGAHIESLSLGCAAPCSDPTTSSAIAYARNTKGVMMVIAAGNEAGAVAFPGSDVNAFTVACTDSANRRCSFSNFGSSVEISAPGLDIYSTWIGSTYTSISGTSMSTPHVSGIAALVKTANPTFTEAQLRNAIQTTAKALVDSGMGSGLIDAGRAVGSTPPPPSPPGAPTLSGTAGNAQVTLTWTTPSSGSQPINGYKVYRDNVLIATLGVVTTYTNTGLTNGVAYAYQVSATNTVGEGARSNTVTLTPAAAPAPTVPGAPTLNSATAGNAQVTLAWSAPASNGGSAITGYQIWRGTVANGETLFTTTGNVLTYTNTGLTNGVTYFYKVKAVNAIGASALSNERSATPTAPPPCNGGDGEC